MQVCPDNEFHPQTLSRLIGLHQAKEVVVIGNRHRRHIELCDSIQRGTNAEQTVNQGIFAMEPEVNKRGHA